MVKCRPDATPDAPVAVVTLWVERMRQTLADDAPLHREIHVVVEACVLVDGPTERTMVNDDVVVRCRRVGRSIGMTRIIDERVNVTEPATDIPHDNIL